MIIREATGQDINAIVAMGVNVHFESEYRNLTYSQDKVEKLCRKCIGNPSCFVRVAEESSSIIAIFAAYLAQTYFSDDLVSQDILVYVVPGRRGSQAFFRLCLAYIGWAKTMGAKIITLKATSGIDVAKTYRAYTGMGFKMTGGNYNMEVS